MKSLPWSYGAEERSMASRSIFEGKRIVRPNGYDVLRTGQAAGNGFQCTSKIH